MSSKKMTLDDLRHAQTVIRSLDDQFKKSAFAVLGFEEQAGSYWSRDNFDMAFDGDVSHISITRWLRTVKELEAYLGEKHLE